MGRFGHSVMGWKRTSSTTLTVAVALLVSAVVTVTAWHEPEMNPIVQPIQLDLQTDAPEDHPFAVDAGTDPNDPVRLAAEAGVTELGLFEKDNSAPVSVGITSGTATVRAIIRHVPVRLQYKLNITVSRLTPESLESDRYMIDIMQDRSTKGHITAHQVVSMTFLGSTSSVSTDGAATAAVFTSVNKADSSCMKMTEFMLDELNRYEKEIGQQPSYHQPDVIMCRRTSGDPLTGVRYFMFMRVTHGAKDIQYARGLITSIADVNSLIDISTRDTPTPMLQVAGH
eukprot:GFYU01014006.1.p1 GENE.GFYU01014006.1~~GFYU01014006.1.p1  ORF type:complete len:284 (-),score=54.54 GFYU01014006.1:337-1188(-)